MVKMLLFVVLALTCTFAQASNTFYYALVNGTATSTSTQVLAQNNMRNYLIIQNTGTNPIAVNFGSAQVASEGLIIVGGGAYEPIIAPSNSVYLKATTGTSTYNIFQGN